MPKTYPCDKVRYKCTDHVCKRRGLAQCVLRKAAATHIKNHHKKSKLLFHQIMIKLTNKQEDKKISTVLAIVDCFINLFHICYCFSC